MNDHLTNELSRQLHDEVDGWHSAPLTLESVQGRARSIRRRRAAASAGVAAAAVLAVILPVTLGLDGSPDSQRPGVTNTPTQAVDSENPIPESPLAVPFIEGRTLTLPNGVQGQLPRAYRGGVVLGETVLGLRIDDRGNLLLDALDPELQVDESLPLDTSLARNAEGSAIAYVTDGELVVRWDSGQTSFGPVAEGLMPVRLVGGPDCTEGVATCAVYLNDELGGAPRVITNSGSNQAVAGDPLSIDDVSEDGRVTMTTEIREGDLGACGRVYDQTTQTTVFRTCDVTLQLFAPDGQHVSADVAYQDALRDYVAIIDAQSGEKVAELRGDGSFFNEVVWEDAAHLLAVTFRDGEGWSVTRVGVDGTVETAYGPLPGLPEESPLHLLGG